MFLKNEFFWSRCVYLRGRNKWGQDIHLQILRTIDKQGPWFKAIYYTSLWKLSALTWYHVIVDQFIMKRHCTQSIWFKSPFLICRSIESFTWTEWFKSCILLSSNSKRILGIYLFNRIASWRDYNKIWNWRLNFYRWVYRLRFRVIYMRNDMIKSFFVYVCVRACVFGVFIPFSFSGRWTLNPVP